MTLKDVGELSPPGTASQSRREVAASSWARGRKWKCRGQELRQVPGITRHWVAPSMGNRSPHPTSTPGRRGSWGTGSQAQAAGDHTAQLPCLALPPNRLQSPDPTLLPPWASVSPSVTGVLWKHIHRAVKIMDFGSGILGSSPSSVTLGESLHLSGPWFPHLGIGMVPTSHSTDRAGLFIIIIGGGRTAQQARSYFHKKGSNLHPLPWKLGVLTTGPPRKSQRWLL